MTRPSSPAPPDGVLRYRLDLAGAALAVLPTSSTRARHTLVSGVSTVVAAGGELRVDHSAPVAAPGGADTGWCSIGDRPYPDRVELDERFSGNRRFRHPEMAERQGGGES
ncbi:hypothetical protein V5P93_003939 [Actinokineospora auranticolor]|nr:hypothetical protein [Actinokineospora auranticolor]